MFHQWQVISKVHYGTLGYRNGNEIDHRLNYSHKSIAFTTQTICLLCSAYYTVHRQIQRLALALSLSFIAKTVELFYWFTSLWPLSL